MHAYIYANMPTSRRLLIYYTHINSFSQCMVDKTLILMSFPVLSQGSIHTHKKGGRRVKTDLICQTFSDRHVVMITQTGSNSILTTVHVSMCPCVHVSMYSCVHVSICPCIHVYVFMCMYSCVHVSICPYVHMSICPYVHVFMCPYGLVSMCPYVHMDMYTYPFT